MIKTFILDPNVLLHDPSALWSFQDNTVLIPIEVIEEIDRFKRESSDRGQNARTVSRMLDQIRGQGRLSEGVPLPGGGSLRILLHRQNGTASVTANGTTVDDRLIALTRDVHDSGAGQPTVLVTKDINLRIKADAVGLQAQNYETDRVRTQDLYTGAFELTLAPEALAALRSTREVILNGAGPRSPNEYCTVVDASSGKRSMLTRVDSSGQKLVPLLDVRDGVWGIRPKNREQYFALDALLNEDLRLVTLMGKAGTGKTLLALAAGLRKIVQDREYRRLVVARPTIPMGRELGYLPGSLEEKLEPWMQPIYDALEMLSDLNMGRDERRPSELIRSGLIAVEALSFIRGRNIANQFLVIDEAQNLTPLEVKTIITRVGHGTKILLTGDPYQIDNPYLDASSNGFSYVATKFRSHPIAAHIELQKGERSELAEVAANIL